MTCIFPETGFNCTSTYYEVGKPFTLLAHVLLNVASCVSLVWCLHLLYGPLTDYLKTRDSRTLWRVSALVHQIVCLVFCIGMISYGMSLQFAFDDDDLRGRYNCICSAGWHLFSHLAILCSNLSIRALLLTNVKGINKNFYLFLACYSGYVVMFIILMIFAMYADSPGSFFRLQALFSGSAGLISSILIRPIIDEVKASLLVTVRPGTPIPEKTAFVLYKLENYKFWHVRIGIAVGFSAIFLFTPTKVLYVPPVLIIYVYSAQLAMIFWAPMLMLLYQGFSKSKANMLKSMSRKTSSKKTTVKKSKVEPKN